MTKVEHNGILYAIKVSPRDDAEEVGKTAWFGDPSFSLQGSLMHYDDGKIFKEHRHKPNPRTIPQTQEAFVVVRGEIEVSVRIDWETEPVYLRALPGEAIFIWAGFHGLKIIEPGTMCYEFKAGCWCGSIEQDKEFWEPKHDTTV